MLARIDNRELDTGPKGRVSERFCAASREVKPADEMIRFVLGPDDTVIADLKRKLPGRGLWITATRDVLAEAVRRKVFARGFKIDARVPVDFVDFTERLLERSALDALAIAGKAGQAVTGFMKVETVIEHGDIAAVLHARDAGIDGIRKLDGAIRRRFGAEKQGIAVIRDFTSSQLDLALGRPNVVHATLLAGPASHTFLVRALRLARFRTGDPGKPGLGNAPRQDA